METQQLNNDQKEVLNAYTLIRKNNINIPDHILNTMRDSAIEVLKSPVWKSQMANTDRISDTVLDYIRESIREDTRYTKASKTDERINRRINIMTNHQVFDRWCEWNGLINWAGRIRDTIWAIYGADLKE